MLWFMDRVLSKLVMVRWICLIAQALVSEALYIRSFVYNKHPNHTTCEQKTIPTTVYFYNNIAPTLRVPA